MQRRAQSQPRARSCKLGRGMKHAQAAPGAAMQIGPRAGVEIRDHKIEPHAARKDMLHKVEPCRANCLRAGRMQLRRRVEHAKACPDFMTGVQKSAFQRGIGLGRGQKDAGSWRCPDPCPDKPFHRTSRRLARPLPYHRTPHAAYRFRKAIARRPFPWLFRQSAPRPRSADAARSGRAGRKRRHFR